MRCGGEDRVVGHGRETGWSGVEGEMGWSGIEGTQGSQLWRVMTWLSYSWRLSFPLTMSLGHLGMKWEF